MIRQLAHLNFITNDLSKIIDFYVNKLGLKTKFIMRNREGIPFGYYFDCGNVTFIEFFDQALAAKEWGGDVGDLNLGRRYKHFCLEVIGLDAYIANLRTKDVAVERISMGIDHSRQAWITDPDGNSIELHEYGPESLQLVGNGL